MADIRAQDETVSGMLKVFNCLMMPFHHDVQKHSIVFGAVANIVNLKIVMGNTWNVELSE